MPFIIQGLLNAIEQNTSRDAFAPSLTPAQWNLFEGYLQLVEMSPGQVMAEQNARDRILYFIETGALSVHFLDAKGEVKLSILNPGSVVGEGGFFSRGPRVANIAASGHTRAWRLTPVRFSEMSNRQPELALELVLALGSVMHRRLTHRALRNAVT